MAKAPTKTQVLNTVADSSGVGKKEVTAVLVALAGMIGDTISDGETPFTIPGLCKIVVQHKEAKPERPGTNPFTGEPTIFKAQPAKNVVKIRPLKGLKDMVGQPGA